MAEGARVGVLYRIQDRHFGIADEYFMAGWTGIQPEMMSALSHSSLNVNAERSEILSMFPEKELKDV